MPALSSSPISGDLEQLGDLPAGDRALLACECRSLIEYLQQGARSARPARGAASLTSLLLAVVAAVLAGAQSLAAVGEWAADAAHAGTRRQVGTR